VNVCNITQKGETFELKINNTTFDSIINDPNAKTKPYSHSAQSHKQLAPLEPGVSRTTKILLEMDQETNANKGESRPDFQSALDKLKGVRPALEKKNAEEKPHTTKPTNPVTQTQPHSTKNSKPATTTTKNDPYDLWNIDFTQGANTQ